MLSNGLGSKRAFFFFFFLSFFERHACTCACWWNVYICLSECVCLCVTASIGGFLYQKSWASLFSDLLVLYCCIGVVLSNAHLWFYKKKSWSSYFINKFSTPEKISCCLSLPEVSEKEWQACRKFFAAYNPCFWYPRLPTKACSDILL